MSKPGAAKSAGAADAVTLCFGVVPQWLRPSLVVALAAALAPCSARAQEKTKPPKAAPAIVSPTQEAKRSPTLADYPQEPLVYETVRSVMRYENDGTGSIDIQVRMRAQTLAGVERAGQLIFSYNAANQREQILLVRVTKPDGRIITAGPEAAQDLSAPVAQAAPMYTDARQVHVTVPGFSVGDELDYHVTQTQFEPLTPGEFWNSWNFVDDAICLDEQVDLNVPAERTLKIASPDGKIPTPRMEGNRKIYHWQRSNLRSPKALARFQGATTVSTHQILFSTFGDWEAVGKWWTKLEAPRRQVTPEIRAKAEELTRGAKTDVEKVQAIYEWVQRNIRYVSLSFGIGRYQPHAAAEVLANAYGDCKDKTTLIDALLDAVGLHGSAVLASTGKPIDMSVPSPIQFDHAINTIWLGSQQYWFDSTLAVAPFGYLIPELRGKNSLVAYIDRKPEIASTASLLPWPTKYEFEMDGKADKTSFDGHITAIIRGDVEVGFRMILLQVPSSQLEEFFREAAAKANAASHDENVSFTDVKASDPFDTREPLKFEGNMKATGPAASSEDGDSATGLESFLKPLIPEVSTADGKPLPTNVNGPKEIIFRAKLSGHQATRTLPKPIHIVKNFAEYDCDIEADGDSLKIYWRVFLTMPAVPETQADEYVSFRREVVDSLTAISAGFAASPAKSDSHTEHAAAHTPLPDALDAYKRAQADLKNGELGDAIEELRSATELDSKYADAWALLGETYARMHEYPSAEEAYRKSYELAPENEASVIGLTQAMISQGKTLYAADFLRERIKAAPDDGQAHYRLGQIYAGESRNDEAIHELEQAATMLPKDASVQIALGTAYFRGNATEKASAALEHATALDPTIQTMNTVAYAFAEHKVHLDHASGYAEHAVREAEKQMNALTLETPRPARSLAVITMAAYWDTLGWVKFQQRDLKTAEKYLRAACDVTDDVTISYHLGRVLEDEGRKQEAIRFYIRATAYLSPLAPVFRGSKEPAKIRVVVPVPIEDQSAAMRRLIALVGSADEADESTSKARGAKLGYVVDIPNEKKMAGTLSFELLLAPGPKIEDISADDTSSELAALAEKIRATKMEQTFPDEGTRRIPFTGTLTCLEDGPCQFRLAPTPFISNFPAPAP